MNVNPNDEALRQFVGKVAGRIGQEAPWLAELGCYQLTTQNWGPVVTKMHHFFLMTRDDNASAVDFETWVKACEDWALHNYEGLPRGLQKGIAIYPVLLQTQARADVVEFVKQKPKSHWAAFTLPTVVDLASGTPIYMDATPVWGWAMWKGIKKAATEALG